MRNNANILCQPQNFRNSNLSNLTDADVVYS